MKATMADVAARAGVSQTTVSRVLNRHPRINGQTREDVLKAMRALGYKHAAVGEGSVRLIDMNIGLVMCPRPEQSNPLGLSFFGEAVAGIQAQAADFNARVTLSTLPADVGDIDQDKLDRERLSGLILLGYPSLELTESMRRRSIKHVSLSGDPVDKLSDGVTVDNFEAGAEACRHLLSWGCRRIASIMTDNERIRLEGFKYELRRNGLEMPAERCLTAESTDTSAFIEAGHAFAKSSEPPDAILITHYDAAKAIRSLFELMTQGRGIPKLITFYHSPRECEIASMQLHPALMGRKAMRRLAFIMDNPDEQPETIVVPMTFKDAIAR